MIPLITDHLEQIRDACDVHKVRQLYLFGSAARGDDFNEDSDVDFMYDFKKEEIPFPEYADNFFDFRFLLEDLLKRKVDLMPGDKISNPFFLKKVDAEKIKIYGN